VYIDNIPGQLIPSLLPAGLGITDFF